MTKLGTIAFWALLASAAAAADISDQAAYNGAVLKHGACTEAAAVEIAKNKGNPYDLALQAMRACRMEEAEIAKLASREVMNQVLGNTLYLRIRTIREVRDGPRPPYMFCGDCPLLQRWDDRMQIWKQPGR
jgi:hypothetical protein